MDREDRGRIEPLPAHVGRRQRRGPIVRVDNVGAPIRVGHAFRDFRGSHGKTGETDVIVVMVGAARAIRRTFPIVKRVANDEVDGQPVVCFDAAERPFRQTCDRGHVSDDVDTIVTRAKCRVSRSEDPYIAQAIERARQSCGDFAQPAGLEISADFGRDEQDAQIGRPARGPRTRNSRVFCSRHSGVPSLSIAKSLTPNASLRSRAADV